MFNQNGLLIVTRTLLPKDLKKLGMVVRKVESPKRGESSPSPQPQDHHHHQQQQRNRYPYRQPKQPKMQLIRAAHKPSTPSRQPTETFSGTVHMDPIFNADDCMGNNVCFTPGARTFWHTHERGQILTVTMGTGLICSKGEEPKRLMVGDVVHIPAGETHWHGAGEGTLMAHMAISLGKTSWHEEVPQEVYDKANQTAN